MNVVTKRREFPYRVVGRLLLAITLTFTLLHTSSALAAQANSSKATHAATAGEVHEYSPTRDAAADILHAVEVAKKSGKHVLLVAGGDWCIWCKILDRYFSDNPDLLAMRQEKFVMVKVNFSQDNENEAVLGKYPKATGYPHLYVLDGRGKLIRSQDTSELEQGKSYNKQKMQSFLQSYGPQKK